MIEPFSSPSWEPSNLTIPSCETASSTLVLLPTSVRTPPASCYLGLLLLTFCSVGLVLDRWSDLSSTVFHLSASSSHILMMPNGWQRLFHAAHLPAPCPSIFLPLTYSREYSRRHKWGNQQVQSLHTWPSKPWAISLFFLAGDPTSTNDLLGSSFRWTFFLWKEWDYSHVLLQRWRGRKMFLWARHSQLLLAHLSIFLLFNSILRC